MTDFLQFSLLDMTPYNRQSWFNLVGEYNQAMRLMYPVAIIYVLLFLGLLFKPFNKISQQQSVRCLLALFAVAWIWVGAVFHLQYFVNLNWAASWFSYLFIAQGVFLLLAGLLLKSGKLLGPDTLRGRISSLLVVMGVLIYPLSLMFENRNMMQLEWFPLHPAPLLIISFALLIRLESRWRYLLMFIPIVWAIVSSAFAYSLGLLEFYFTLSVLITCLMIIVLDLLSNVSKTAKK